MTATLSLVTLGTGPVQLDTPVSATVTSPTNDFTATTVTFAAFGLLLAVLGALQPWNP